MREDISLLLTIRIITQGKVTEDTEKFSKNFGVKYSSGTVF